MNIPDMYHCDTVYLQIANKGQTPLDLTALYVDGSSCIVVPRTATGGFRLRPGEASGVVSLQLGTWDIQTNQPLATGIERIILLGTRVPAALASDQTSLPHTFEYLAGRGCNAIAPTPGSRGQGNGGLSEALTEAVFGSGRTIRIRGDPGSADVGAKVVRWRMQPPAS